MDAPPVTRRRRSPARFLAPIALLATVAGIYVIVHMTVDGGAASGHPAPSHQPASRPGRRSTPLASTLPETTTTRSTAGRFYTVRPGDSLDAIAARTGVPLKTLETLNPGVSSTALHVGQRLALSR